VRGRPRRRGPAAETCAGPAGLSHAGAARAAPLRPIKPAAIDIAILLGYHAYMNEVTRVLSAIEAGNPQAAAQLLPLVYDELRRLAAGHMANESPGHTLNPTALVHEAYVRLVGPVGDRSFANRSHFFAAAAEAMRRILLDCARRKRSSKRGGGLGPSPVDVERLPASVIELDSWLDLDAALAAFEKIDGPAAALAKIRIFSGLSVEQAADSLGMSRATAFRTWTYARAWLTAALADRSENS
jgi:RNA polymerase sigma factor (TIGR02999 family)